MNILNQLTKIKSYYEVTRQVGHTNGMFNGVKNTKKPIVMVMDTAQGKHIKKTIEVPKDTIFTSINSANGLRGRKNPLFIDNAVMWVLCNKAVTEIERLKIKCGEV
jgi:hypothetical protein